MVRKKGILIVLVILVVWSMLSLIDAGGGGVAISVTTIELTEEGINYNITPSRLKFEFNERWYAIQVREVKENYTKFLVMTLDINNLDNITAYTLDDSFDLLIGDSKEIDVDKDGINDIFITLNNITYENLGKIGYRRVPWFFIKKINIEKLNVTEEYEDKEKVLLEQEGNIGTEEEIIIEQVEVKEDLIDNITEESNNSSSEDRESTPPNLWQRVVNWFKKLFRFG